MPRYETSRGPGSTSEVDYWTSKDVREVTRSHVNYVVADTRVWEQSAAYVLDTHPAVDAFVKNAGLGFAIPYLHNGQSHDYQPDFIVRLTTNPVVHLILETEGLRRAGRGQGRGGRTMGRGGECGWPVRDVAVRDGALGREGEGDPGRISSRVRRLAASERRTAAHRDGATNGSTPTTAGRRRSPCAMASAVPGASSSRCT